MFKKCSKNILSYSLVTQDISFDSFLTCAGLGSATTPAFPPEDAQKLRGLLAAGFDLYNFFVSFTIFMK